MRINTIVNDVTYFQFFTEDGFNGEREVRLGYQDINQSIINLKEGAKISDVVEGYLEKLSVFDLKRARFGKRYEAEFPGGILRGDFRKVGEVFIPDSYFRSRKFFEQQISEEIQQLKCDFDGWKIKNQIDTFEEYVEIKRKSMTYPSRKNKLIFKHEELQELLDANKKAAFFYNDYLGLINDTIGWTPFNPDKIFRLNLEQIR